MPPYLRRQCAEMTVFLRFLGVLGVVLAAFALALSFTAREPTENEKRIAAAGVYQGDVDPLEAERFERKNDAAQAAHAHTWRMRSLCALILGAGAFGIAQRRARARASEVQDAIEPAVQARG